MNMPSDEQRIKDIEQQIFALQRQLYDSPLRSKGLRKVMAFNATIALADKIALAASEKGVTRSELLRQLVENSLETPNKKSKAAIATQAQASPKLASNKIEVLEF